MNDTGTCRVMQMRRSERLWGGDGTRLQEKRSVGGKGWAGEVRGESE